MANEKILVVDDDTNICELLRLYLTKEGYQVSIANDGEAGLAQFSQVKPDMVLLDVMMPRMDGLEVYLLQVNNILLKDYQSSL